MRIVFFGTGGAGSSPYRARVCIGIETNDVSILVDVGEGCGSRMIELNYTLNDFDLIFISHEHLNHWAGLFDALVYTSIYDRAGVKRLKLVSGPKNTDLLNKVLSYMPKNLRDSLEIAYVTENGVRYGDTVIRAIEVQHTVPTYGIEVRDSSIQLFYSADTYPVIDRVYQGLKPNIIIHEASLTPNQRDIALTLGHTTLDDALRLREHVQDLLVIVHLGWENEKYLKNISMPKNVFIPSDKTLVSI